jgi:phosphate-selective porin OprO/OprP
MVPPCSAEPPPPEWKLAWWPKLELSRSDGQHRLRFGGRVLLDGALIRYDRDLSRRSSPAGWSDDGELRQGRIYVRGSFFRALELKTEVDFAPAEISLTDAYVGWRRLGPLGTARFGHQKVPFSIEQQTSRLHLLFMERSLANALDPSVRDLGLTLRDTALGERLRWAVGGFRSTEADGRQLSPDSNWVASAHVTGLPLWADDGRRLLHLGVSYAHGFRGGDTLSVKQRPESNLADALVSTGTIAGVDAVDAVGAELAWVHGPFSVQAEWSHLFVERGGGDLDFPGFYVHASWFVTGEHRAYSREEARFAQVAVRKGFDPRRGGWGALQLAARVSYVDLDDRDVRGGRQTDTTLGVNWWPFPFLRLTVNWVHGWVHGEGDVDVVQARFQLAY